MTNDARAPGSARPFTVAPGRRLSKPRLATLVLAMVGLVAGTAFGVQRLVSPPADTSSARWFAGYVDATLTPTYAFEAPSKPSGQHVVLGFVVAAPRSPCTPSWGGAYTLDEAATGIDLDRRVTQLRRLGGDVAVSFGGLSNAELGTVCRSTTKLAAAYRAVVERYGLTTIDLDLEGEALTTTAGFTRRAKAVKTLQDEAVADGRRLEVWLTLPVDANGLTESGRAVTAGMLAAGVDLAGVNAMTMNYGTSRPEWQSMRAATEAALTSLHGQLGALYRDAGQRLSDGDAWSKVGATPMIGQNDEATDRFTLDDAEWLGAFAVDRGIGRLSMWSMNRDTSCGPNYTTLAIAADACSGLEQAPGAFAATFHAAHDARPPAVASPSPGPTSLQDLEDDPATSPYGIWRADRTYPAGSKVVWKRNVYRAKWWASEVPPDTPVAEWATAWSLVGPVLPDETPVPQTSFAARTYQTWNEGTNYHRGDRVLHKSLGYQATRFTTGETPGDPRVAPVDSPWKQILPDQ